MHLIAAVPLRGEGSAEAPPPEREAAAVAFAAAMTRSDRDVDDRLFASLRAQFSDAELVELGAWIALQTFYSTFNRAFRIEPPTG